MFSAGRPVCIVNPNSAGGRTAERWPRLRYELEQVLGAVDCLLTSARGEAIELARDAASTGAGLVIAVGGDGTINEVVNGLMLASSRQPELTLALLPAGTGSDLSRSLGIPHDTTDALRLLALGRRRPLDLGRVDFTNPRAQTPTRWFANIASIGIEGLVDRRMDSAPRVLGAKATYLWATASAAIAYQPARVVLQAGPLEIRRTVLSVVLANGRFFGGGMEIAPSARIDDGRLELIIIQASPLWRLALDAPRLYNGSIYQARGVEHFTVSTLEASSQDGEQVLLGIDGEPIGELPVRFSVVPAALQVIANV